MLYYIVQLKPVLSIEQSMEKADALKWMETKAKSNPKGPSCTSLSPDKTLLEYNDGNACYKYAAVSAKKARDIQKTVNGMLKDIQANRAAKGGE